MGLVKFIKDMQVKFEAIPAPSAIFYNVAKILEKSSIFINYSSIASM